MELTHGSGRRRGENQQREPAAKHFGKLERMADPQSDRFGDIAGPFAVDRLESASCRFDVYRADEVRMTSTQFGGGDWHWRLSDAVGLILLDTGGYASERECRGAIAILQENAGWARVSPSS